MECCGKGAESFQNKVTVMPALRLSDGKPPGEECYWAALGWPSFYCCDVLAKLTILAVATTNITRLCTTNAYSLPYACIYFLDSYIIFRILYTVSKCLRNRCHRSQFTVSNLWVTIDLLTGTVRCSLEASLFVQISASFVAKNADDPVG